MVLTASVNFNESDMYNILCFPFFWHAPSHQNAPTKEMLCCSSSALAKRLIDFLRSSSSPAAPVEERLSLFSKLQPLVVKYAKCWLPYEMQTSGPPCCFCETDVSSVTKNPLPTLKSMRTTHTDRVVTASHPQNPTLMAGLIAGGLLVVVFCLAATVCIVCMRKRQLDSAATCMRHLLLEQSFATDFAPIDVVIDRKKHVGQEVSKNATKAWRRCGVDSDYRITVADRRLKLSRQDITVTTDIGKLCFVACLFFCLFVCFC